MGENGAATSGSNQAGDHATRLTLAVMGCGARGQGFADWIARHPDAARVVAVADPCLERRDLIGDRHNVPAEFRFNSWEELLARPRFADLAINTLMDQLHVGAGVAALELGYHMLLEKPMAVTLADCIAIDEARRRNDRIVSVCHSLRHHPTFWGSSPGSEIIEIPPDGEGTHDGCDDQIMEALVRAVRENDPSLVLTGTAESLRTHTVTFAAELARREGRIVEVGELRRSGETKSMTGD